MSGVYWEHDEYDHSGRCIARYKSFDEISAAGLRQSGWRKYDSDGNLVAEGKLDL